MITADGKDKDWNFSAEGKYAYNLMEYTVNLVNDAKLNSLKKEIVECAIALKLVVRTYNLVKS